VNVAWESNCPTEIDASGGLGISTVVGALAMGKLILGVDGFVLKEIPISKGRMTLGRRSTNDIQIDNLAISGEHAAVVTLLGDSFLEDLDSTNGTIVNGQRIRKHLLKDGDVIELARYRLTYVADSDSGSQSKLRFGVRVEVPLGALRVVDGPNVGRQMDLSKSSTTLGKPGMQIVAVARRPEGYFISQVEGTEFPLVNGKRLEAPVLLSDHDVIEVAGTRMEFVLKE
jgi:pSer/pThr/pTyr-binding forkhead associated (FHA) protein